jgi:hypothetical protein
VGLHQFFYTTFDPPNVTNRVYRPILGLQIVNGKMRLPCFGIVDSGADFCAFPMTFAHALGLNPLNQTPSSTIGAGSGGPALTYHFDVVLEFPKLGAIPLRAGFMDSLNAVGVGLLGHSGFLDRLVVSFNAQKRVFHIETPDPPSPIPQPHP